MCRKLRYVRFDMSQISVSYKKYLDEGSNGNSDYGRVEISLPLCLNHGLFSTQGATEQ